MKKLLLILLPTLLVVGCKQNFKPVNKCFVFNGKGDSVEVKMKYDTVDVMKSSFINDTNNWYEKSFAKRIIPVKNVNQNILDRLPALINSLAVTCKAACKYPLTFAPVKNDSVHVYFIRARIERPDESLIIRKIDSMQIARYDVEFKLDSIARALWFANKITESKYFERRIFIADSLTKQAFKDSVLMMDSFKNDLPSLIARFKKDSLTFNRDSCDRITFCWTFSCTNGMGVPTELKIRIGYSPYTLKELPYTKEILTGDESENR